MTLPQSLSHCASTKGLPVHRLAFLRRPPKVLPRSRSLNPPPTTQCPHSHFPMHVPMATRPHHSPPCPRAHIHIQMSGGSHHQIRHKASRSALAVAQDNKRREQPQAMESQLRPLANGEGPCQSHSQNRRDLKPQTRRVSSNGHPIVPTDSTPPLCQVLVILSNNNSIGLLRPQIPLPMLSADSRLEILPPSTASVQQLPPRQQELRGAHLPLLKLPSPVPLCDHRPTLRLGMLPLASPALRL